MTRVKRLYRVRAYYPWAASPTGENIITRHFQSKEAAERWADQRREGYPETNGYPFVDDGDYYRPAIPPATRVTVDVSDPITWPEP
jgi:hypothetical protein